MPIRTPVKDPGPTPTTTRSTALGSSPAPVKSSSASASTRTARDARSPSASPSRTSALVATPVAVSNASVSTGGELDRDSSPGRVHVAQPYRRARVGQNARAGFRPLDEADRAGEVRLEVAPLRRRDVLEPEQVEVRDVRRALVA